MISISGFILGVINIGIVAVLLVLVGLLIEWLFVQFEKPLPVQARKFYLLLILLVALYMVVALLFGLPVLRVL